MLSTDCSITLDIGNTALRRILRNSELSGEHFLYIAVCGIDTVGPFDQADVVCFA